MAILNSGFGIPGRARNPQNPARDGNRCGGKGLGDKLRVSEMVGQFVEKRPHTCSDQVRCTCGRLAGELPGKCREWSGDGRAEGGRLGLMYVPPALSGGLSSPTQTPQYPTSPQVSEQATPVLQGARGGICPWLSFASPAPPPLLPLQSVAILGSGCRVCSRLWLVAQLAGAPPHRLCTHSFHLPCKSFGHAPRPGCRY